jgi:hypothetical protein
MVATLNTYLPVRSETFKLLEKGIVSGIRTLIRGPRERDKSNRLTSFFARLVHQALFQSGGTCFNLLLGKFLQ